MRQTSLSLCVWETESQGLLGARLWEFYCTQRGSCLCLSCALASAFKECGSKTQDKAVPEAGKSGSAPQNSLLLLLTASSRHSQFKMHINYCSMAGTHPAVQMCYQTHWEVSFLMWCSTISDKIKDVEFCIYWLSSFPELKHLAEKSGWGICV